MQATQAVFDNRFTMSYGSTNSMFNTYAQLASSASRFTSNAFFSSGSFGYAPPRSVTSHFEREVIRTPSGSAIKTSMTTVRQPSDPYGRNGQLGPANCLNGRNHGYDNDRCHVPPPPASRCPQPPRNCPSGVNWSNTPVKDNKASIDLGDYQLNLDKKDSSITMRNNRTGDTTKIWGDPHIDLHDGTANKASGTFKGSTTLNLNDNTKVTVTPKPDGNSAVTYADQVTITNGKDSIQISGLSEKSKRPLSIERGHNGYALDAVTPDGYSLMENCSGTGWIDPNTGKEPTKADFAKV
ncbi:hypothetical protein GCM10027093_49360 [Paraburkholderia jirisanensis]